MKLYTPIEAKIKHLDFEGKGVLDIPPQERSGNISQKIYKAGFAFPGDVIKGTTVRRDKGDIMVRVDQLTQTSPDRVQKPQCPYVGTCGGCVWQGLQYPKQAEYKQELVNRAFSQAQICDPTTNAPYKLASLAQSPELFYYRNRMDYVFGPNGELGLKEPGKWFSYLDLSTCFLLSPESVEILKRVRNFALQSGLPPYAQKTGIGFFRYLIIREGKRTGERLVNILTSSQDKDKFDAKAFEACLGNLATHILHGVSDNITDLSLTESVTVLKGSSDFTERVNNVTYTIPHGSFFQTNTVMAEQLFNHVAEQILQTQSDSPSAPSSVKEILDLYCGVGFFALGLAKRGIKTHGVEIDPNAIRAAKESAKANNLQDLATFDSAKAEDVSWKFSKAETVIVDPPRAGMHPRVIKNLLEMGPKRIVYVSCKYTRLVQELPEFQKMYKIKSLQAFDLFPHTPHVEVVVVLDRMD